MKTTSVLVILGAYFIVESFCGLVPQKPFECEKGVPYIENECNTCFCINPSDLVCSLKKCPENKDKGLEQCEIGSVWKKDCNTCWCVNMGTICSNYDCNS